MFKKIEERLMAQDFIAHVLYGFILSVIAFKACALLGNYYPFVGLVIGFVLKEFLDPKLGGTCDMTDVFADAIGCFTAFLILLK